MPYKRINWTNTQETPLNAQNLNKIDEGIYNNQSSINSLEQLATYPNTANNCLKGNYSVTNEAVLNVKDGCLNIAQSNASVTELRSDLSDVKVIDNNRLMLIKLRIRMTSGSNLSVYFKYRTKNDELYVIKDNVIASNLNVLGIGNPNFIITDNEYHNIWCIFNSSDIEEIKGVGVELAPFAKVEISNFQAFYSLDEAGNSESYKIVTANYNTVETSTEYEIVEKSEVEI